MKPRTMSLETYLGIVNRLVPQGWLPVGPFGSMVFRRRGRNYDLAAAWLDALGAPEKIQKYVPVSE
jgi:hypothetical protein